MLTTQRDVMSLLNDLYQDVRSNIEWSTRDVSIVASFGNSAVQFTIEHNHCTINVSEFHPVKDHATTIKDMLASFISEHHPTSMSINSLDQNMLNIFEYAFDAVSCMYGYSMWIEDHTLSITESMEILEEEPNSSLMYHRMFPNKRLNAELESYGYKFRDGGGLKLMRKHMGSTNRNSGPHKHRTMQSIVIFKDGRIFRKIPKQKWNQLVDPSDKDSVSWGVAFQQKMVDAERKQRKQQGIEIHFK